MQKLGALLVLIAALTLAPTLAKADDAAIVAEVEAASDALNQAFQRQDWTYIEKHITADHISVFPPWGEPKSFAQERDLIPQLKMKQTPLTEPRVTVLGPNAAMRTVIMALEGSYKGEPLPKRIFKTQIMVKQDGRWLEKFYQSTVLKP